MANSMKVGGVAGSAQSRLAAVVAAGTAMTIQLSYRRLGFFTAVSTAGWLVNLLALQLPLLMPLLLALLFAACHGLVLALFILMAVGV